MVKHISVAFAFVEATEYARKQRKKLSCGKSSMYYVLFKKRNQVATH